MNLTRTTILASLALASAACGGSAMKSPGAPQAEPMYASDDASRDAGEAPAAYPQPGYYPGADADMDGGAAYADDVMAEEAGDPPAPPAPSPAPRATGAAEKSVAIARPHTPHHRPEPSAGPVRAGEWDDNANYRDFKRFLATQDGLAFDRADITVRRFLVVRDAAGKGVPNCAVTVRDGHQNSVQLTTTASGRSLLFPRAEGLHGAELTATTNCAGTRVTKQFVLDDADGVVDLKLDTQRILPQTRTVDIAFVLDTTGSMSEEISAIKGTIGKVAGLLEQQNVRVRIGLVEYKDKTDRFVTKVYPMSTDVRSFSDSVSSLRASGGGDTPEHANEGLRVAMDQLQWSDDSVARLAFLIGDAPPHLDYQDDVSYRDTMQNAAHRGVQFFTIAASGMDDVGQVVWRQVAAYTGGTNMFVLRGGAGPQSTGAGDAKSSCGGTHQNYASGNLDGLISDKIRLTLTLVDTDPMLIAGLGQDERAKPCHERLVIAR